MICILNACKVIFGEHGGLLQWGILPFSTKIDSHAHTVRLLGLIRHESGSEKKSASADDFLPILIFVVLRANPENLISNVEYISRFRGSGKMDGEPGYYLSSLVSVGPA